MPHLIVTKNPCVQCRACQLTCSLNHFQEFNQFKSAIRILPGETNRAAIKVCRQCAKPACVPACPTGALGRDRGVIRLDRSLCNGCRACSDSCPFDGVGFDPSDGRAIICDLCQGRALCAEICPKGSLKVNQSKSTKEI